ncbi:unnamed protein product, partial [Cladocopium goreaui]
FQCALLATPRAPREVHCWGVNDRGQLGQGDTTARPLKQERVWLGGAVQNITSGSHHSCGLLITGEVKCWGANSRGQLGTGDTLNRGDEANEMGDWLMAVQLGGPAVQVAAGAEHSCARMVDGSVKCWGANSQGQALSSQRCVSIGTMPWEMGNALVAEKLPRKAVNILAGLWHTCAILDDKTSKCWGSVNPADA